MMHHAFAARQVSFKFFSFVLSNTTNALKLNFLSLENSISEICVRGHVSHDSNLWRMWWYIVPHRGVSDSVGLVD